MGVVSEIKEYRGRVSVSVDGRLLVRLSRRHFQKCPLEEGQAIDDEAYLSEVAELQYPEAYEAALSRLESCARTEQDMRIALSRKGYVDLAVDRVLMRLTRAGLLNDQEYAQRFVESRAPPAGGALSNQPPAASKGRGSGYRSGRAGAD